MGYQLAIVDVTKYPIIENKILNYVDRLEGVLHSIYMVKYPPLTK